MRREGFPKRIRVRKESEFKRILKNGTKREGQNLAVFRLREGGEEGQKFGIRIPRGIKRALQRNRIKRAIREVLRKNRGCFADNEAVVVVCKSAAVRADLQELTEDLETLIR